MADCRERLSQAQFDDEVPSTKKLAEPPAIERNLGVVYEELATSPAAIRVDSDRRASAARAVAMLRCRRLGDHPLRASARALARSSYSAVSMSIRRFRDSAREDQDLEAMLTDLEN